MDFIGEVIALLGSDPVYYGLLGAASATIVNMLMDIHHQKQQREQMIHMMLMGIHFVSVMEYLEEEGKAEDVLEAASDRIEKRFFEHVFPVLQNEPLVLRLWPF